MPGTVIASGSGTDFVGAAFPGVSFALNAPVAVGDCIAAGGMTFPTNSGSPYPWTISDNLGNVWTERVYLAGPGAFKELHVWSTKVTVPGTPTITINRTSPANSAFANCYARAARDVGDFAEATTYLANFTPTDPTYSTGCGTGDFTLADSWVVTFENFPAGTALTPTSDQHSLTGDTTVATVNSGPAGQLTIWERFDTGPGNGRVEIETVEPGDNNLVTVVFSKPLARPGGTLTQYAVRGGAGFQNQVSPFNDNRPLTITLPYVPVVGAFAAVGIGQQVATLTGLVVTDNAGHTWTQGPTDNTHSNLTVFTTTITGTPPAGTVWQLTLSGTPNVLTTVYQSTEMGVVEILPPSGFTIGTVTFATYLTQTGGGLTVQAFSSAIPNVPAGTLLIAWAIASGVDNGTITWSALESYTLEEHQDFVQYIGEAVNRYRLGVMSMLSKTASALGAYDASVQLNAQETSSALGGNVLLMAVNLDSSISLACPVGGAAGTVGTSYSKQLVVTSGTAPYIFVLV